jgi:ribonuclease HII
MPDFAMETACGGIVCGIDEAGRGPLAGPVVAAAVIVDPRRLKRRVARAIDDSKALDRKLREALYAEIRAGALVGVAAASAAEIDRINILQATLLAMRRAVAALGVVPDMALVDGNVAPRLPCACRTVVGGDGLSLSIAAASIVAKVTRDALMARLALRYPGFGWEANAGYGTEAHRAALERFGPTPHHRKTFRPLVNMLSRL